MPAAFLEPATFADWAKKPAWASGQLVASLLQLVSEWIRDNKPDVEDDDQGAKIVTFEVTRDSLMYGDFGPQASYSKATSHSQRSGTLDRQVIEKFITDRHKRMLGIATYPRPAYHFGD